MKKIILSVVTLAMIFVACNDDRINEEAEFQPMDEFYDNNKPEEQEFIITSDTGDAPIIGNQGTELWGFRNILQYPNGDTVPFPYSLKLIELYSIKDMVMYQMPTLSTTNILEAAADVKITAWHNRNELVLKPNAKYPLVLSTQPTKSGMSVYQGTHPDNVYSNWLAATDGSTVTDTARYGLNVGTLGWQSCAQQQLSGLGTIQFEVEGKGGQYIDLYLIPMGYQGLIKGENLVIQNAPIGAEVTVIAMAKDQNEDFRYFKQRLTVVDNMSIKLEMDVVSENALLGELASF